MGKEKIKQAEKAESDKPIFKGKEAEEFTARWNSITKALKERAGR